MTIKSVGVLSIAKIAAVVYAGLGLLGGIIFACFALVGAGITSAMQQNAQLPPVFSLVFGVGAIVAMPIIYGVMGFILGAISAWLFNIAAGIAGGVNIQVET
jgi:hypothetical protein